MASGLDTQKLLNGRIKMIKWTPMLFLVLSAIFSAAINRDVSAAIYLSAAGICFYLGRMK